MRSLILLRTYTFGLARQVSVTAQTERKVALGLQQGLEVEARETLILPARFKARLARIILVHSLAHSCLTQVPSSTFSCEHISLGLLLRTWPTTLTAATIVLGPIPLGAREAQASLVHVLPLVDGRLQRGLASRWLASRLVMPRQRAREKARSQGYGCVAGAADQKGYRNRSDWFAQQERRKPAH